MDGFASVGVGVLRNWSAPLIGVPDDIANYVFFRAIFDRLSADIDRLGLAMAERMATFLGVIAAAVVTIWVVAQGYRLATGCSRDPAMGVVTDALVLTLAVIAATGVGLSASDLHRLIGQDLTVGIGELVTGRSGDPIASIDQSLAWMQVTLSSIDALEVVGDRGLLAEKSRATSWIMVGHAGPALVTGALLLMFQVALALCVGFAPLFILCAAFRPTRTLFRNWLLYTVGTCFSLAVLSAVAAIVLNMVTAVAAGYWASALLGQFVLGQTGGIGTIALLQGGMGLILTLLLLYVPRMAARFFNETLGEFIAYSAFGTGVRPQAERPMQQPAPPVIEAEVLPDLHLRGLPALPPPTDEIKRLAPPSDTDRLPALTTAQVEERIRVELAAEEAMLDRATWLAAGGSMTAVRPPPGIPVARNGGWDAALNIAADPLGLLEPIMGARAAVGELAQAQAKQNVEHWRQTLTEEGVKVPDEPQWALGAGGVMYRDYQAEMRKLAEAYQDHVRDQRLRESWGDDYANIRIGKSRMTVQEFEQRVYELHQAAVDRRFEQAVEKIRHGELPVVNGYARTAGADVDENVRYDLRLFARKEGLPDGAGSRIMAINRQIRSEQSPYVGIPDLRLGRNVYLDTTLAIKTAGTRQIRRWNDIEPGPTVVIRPSKEGGAYVIPATSRARTK